MQGPQVQQKEQDDAYFFQNYFSYFLFDGPQNRNERQLLQIFSLTCKINKAQSAGKQAVKQYPLQFASTSVNPIPTRKEFMSTIFHLGISFKVLMEHK